jgi:PAS domain S-box-containing protein
MNAQATTSLTATMAVENDMRHRVRTSSFPAPSFHTPSSLTTELEAAALQHSPVPTLLLDRYQVVCVANRAAQKLFGSIDSLIGQSFSDFKIDFVNKAGFSKLDCDSVLASLEDRWLGRRDSVTWPSFNVTSRRVRSTRIQENGIDETFGTSHVGKSCASPEENLQNDADSQEMHVDVSIPRMLDNSPNENHDPTKARMTASTFAVQGQPYYLLTFKTVGVHMRPTLFVPSQTPARQPSDRILPSMSRESLIEATADLHLTSVEREWPDIVERMRHSVFDATRAKVMLLSADERYCMPNKNFLQTLGFSADRAFACGGIELISKIDAWDENFGEKLSMDDFPLIDLVRTRRDFRGRRIGFMHKVTGVKKVFNVSGECIHDTETGTFLGGIARFQELEELTKLLRYHKAWIGDHETICNIMPHLIWTMMPDGSLDYFSERWYEYTGLTPEQSLGLGYQQAIHPCDLWKVQGNRPALMESGDYEMEIRHRRFDGQYRWFLTRSKPLRDHSGKIIKYYGTNTDIHHLVMARERERRAKEQLKIGLAHAEIHVFGVNKEGIIDLSEGDNSWAMQGVEIAGKMDLLGKNAFDLMNTIPSRGALSHFGEAMRNILNGSKSDIAVLEDKIHGRSFRTRFIPDYDPRDSNGPDKPGNCGLIGVSIDISDLKARVALEIEKEKLQVLEQAANASNRLKSQFLANVSHPCLPKLEIGVDCSTDIS